MTAIPHQPSEAAGDAGKVLSHHGAVYEAYRILQFGFVAMPIVVGLDKFVGFLTDWSKYLAPWVVNMMGHDYSMRFMMVVGVVEIAAGIGVAVKPKWFGYVVAAWLCAIIVNLLIQPAMYYDIAIRDLGLAIAALALARLARHFDHGWFGGLMTRAS